MYDSKHHTITPSPPNMKIEDSSCMIIDNLKFCGPFEIKDGVVSGGAFVADVH